MRTGSPSAPSLALLLAVSAWPACAQNREPVVGLPCEGCEAIFTGMPASPPSQAVIAPASETGERLVIDGIVRTRDSRPAAGIVVYAYHTNDRGLYPPGETRHGRLRGWAATDAQGRYRFTTIRPAGYPDSGVPQHVHMHVLEPGRCTYSIDELLFDDDPRLGPVQRAEMTPGRGGPGLVRPEKDAAGVWHVRRDIALGEKIPGYPEKP